MKLQRFFVEKQLGVGKEIRIEAEEVLHQIGHVFRKRAGDQIVLLDNTGFEFLSTIQIISKKELVVKVEQKEAVKNVPQCEVVLFAALIKKDNFEWVLEKCTELGVSHFVPVVSERVEKKDLNIERAHKILREASEQSERGVVPTLSSPVSLEDALQAVDFPVYALHLDGERFDTEKIKVVSMVGLLIGPEGGWGERDLEIFKKMNVPTVTLGTQVLRAETASVAVCAKVLI